MMMVATTPLGSLLMVFFAVPVSVMIGIYGTEGAQAYFHRRPRSKP